MNDDIYKQIVRLRGVDDPCTRCKGLGTCMYGSGSTWKGGMSTCSCQVDVCDVCWGTGDKHRIGVNLKKLYDYKYKQEEKACSHWLIGKTGLNYKSVREGWKHLLIVLDKECNKRKIPGNSNISNYHTSVSVLRNTLGRLIEGIENEENIRDIIE